METFRVLIKVEQYILHKELILKIISKKLKTNKVEARCFPDCFTELFEKFPEVTRTSLNHIYNYNACILDKKEEVTIYNTRKQGVKLIIIE